MITLHPEILNRNGVTKVLITARDGDRVVHSDRITLESARSRTAFVRAICKRVLEPDATATLEADLLALIDQAAADEGSTVDDRPDASEQGNEAEQNIPPGQCDPDSGRIVLSAKRTLPTAIAAVQEHWNHADGRTINHYAGNVTLWAGNRHTVAEDRGIKKRLQEWLHGAMMYVRDRRTGELELADFEANPATVNAAFESLCNFVHLPTSINAPAWLETSRKAEFPDPSELLSFPAGSLHVPTGKVIPPTPLLFNHNAIEFDYDPHAEPPERWIQFLEQLWGDDLESVFTLQEIMGYLLVADTSQQKAFLLVGPRRSGKGTIGRVVTQLVGAGNVAGPTTSSLAGPFGLQPLISKSVAIVSDARFTGEGVGVVTERLLCITGEDLVTIDQKHTASLEMRLRTRFLFLSNELPRMNDSSGALASRFIILRLTRSFFGQEDPTLTDKLIEELPGILAWAIEGLKRLRQRGHFLQPKASAKAARELEDLASPVGAFVRDRCHVGPGLRAWVDDLYAAWKSWCEQQGWEHVSNRQTFGRDLSAAVAGVTRKRGVGNRPFYSGIGLRSALVMPGPTDADDEADEQEDGQ